MERRNDVCRRVSQQIFLAQGNTGTAPLQSTQKPLAELGLDSLKLIEIIYELETFYQLDVDEERLAELDKIDDLIELFVSALETKQAVVAQGEKHGQNSE